MLKNKLTSLTASRISTYIKENTLWLSNINNFSVGSVFFDKNNGNDFVIDGGFGSIVNSAFQNGTSLSGIMVCTIIFLSF